MERGRPDDIVEPDTAHRENEIPGSLDCKQSLGIAATDYDRQEPLHQDHDIVCRVALSKQTLADVSRANLPVFREQAHLLIRQLRNWRWVVVIQQGRKRASVGA
jgi:hypothetical protein